jgi:hypothetical protein
VIHERHFSVAEANAALAWVTKRIEAIREARDRLAEPEAHSALAKSAPANGGGEEGRAVGEAFRDVRRLLVELQATGIILRDLDRGLVDFPALRDGHEVYLCWELGEDRVGWWHELEAGFSGRQALGWT